MDQVGDEFDTGQQTEALPERVELLRQQVVEAHRLSMRIEQGEELLKELKARLHALQSKAIPDTMLECSMTETTISTPEFNYPLKVGIKEIVSGTLPKDPDRRAKAIAWLTKNDGGGLIKTSIEMEFGRSQHAAAIKLAKQLKKRGFELTVVEGVHAQTLGKYARDRLKEGDPIDFEILGLYTGKVAEIKEAKKK